MILPVIFGSLSVLGMEALVKRPLWYLYGALFFLGLSAISAFSGSKLFVFSARGGSSHLSLAREVSGGKNFFREIVVFCLFFSGAVTMLFYLENAITRQILIMVSSIVYAARVSRLGAGEKKTTINFLFCIFLSFVSSTALFGLNLFFAVPTVYLAGTAFFIGYLIFLEIAAATGDREAALPVFGAVFWGEIFFVMLMLPNAVYLGSAVLALFTFVFGEIFYIKRAEPRYGIRLAVFSMILLLLLFLTAKWI